MRGRFLQQGGVLAEEDRGLQSAPLPFFPWGEVGGENACK